MFGRLSFASLPSSNEDYEVSDPLIYLERLANIEKQINLACGQAEMCYTREPENALRHIAVVEKLAFKAARIYRDLIEDQRVFLGNGGSVDSDFGQIYVSVSSYLPSQIREWREKCKNARDVIADCI